LSPFSRALLSLGRARRAMVRFAAANVSKSRAGKSGMGLGRTWLGLGGDRFAEDR